MAIFRGNDYDVSNRIKTTDPSDVNREVRRIYLELFPHTATDALDRLFVDVTTLYRGQHADYWACDTSYHNLQHILDVTLAMGRLMDGYQRSTANAAALTADMFRFGIMTALLHDCGYIRHKKDFRHKHGAEYTTIHVTRSARFVKRYLLQTGNTKLAAEGSRILHFTGNEIPLERLRISDPTLLRLGQMLGSADIVAQMADRCYLEKCYYRLYPEFVLGGVTKQRRYKGSDDVCFSSAHDLIAKTPGFYKDICHRLEHELGRAYHYAERHFGNQNLYVEAVDRNVRYAKRVREKPLLEALRRHLPLE